jgi:myosin heavy subunit
MRRQPSTAIKTPKASEHAPPPPLTEKIQFEKGQYYWVCVDAADYYLPCKLLYPVHDTDQELTLEIYESKTIVQAAQSAVTGLIPPPAHISLEKNYDDLVSAVDISEPAILWNLKKRFRKNEIYSAIGPILIAVNPYQMIDNMYSEEKLRKYLLLEEASNSRKSHIESESDPHIWSIARSSYVQLHESSTRQAIIVSGGM